MKKIILSLLLAVGIFIVASHHPLHAQSKTDADVRTFMQVLSKKVITLVRAPISNDEYSKKMSDLVDQHAAYDQVAAFVLGQYNRQLNDEERAKFKVALIDYFHVFFARQFKNYKGQETIVESVQIGNNDIYNTKVTFAPPAGSNLPALATDWRLWWYNGNFRVMDIMVNNISMIAVMRSEITSIMGQSNGDINQLVSRLRERALTVPVK